MIDIYSLKTHATILSFCNGFLKSSDVGTFPAYLDRTADTFRFGITCSDLSPLVQKTLRGLELMFVMDANGHVVCTWREEAENSTLLHEFSFDADILSEALFEEMNRLVNLFTQSFAKEITRLVKEPLVETDHVFSKIVSVKETQLTTYEVTLENKVIFGIAGDRDDVKEGNFAYMDPSGKLEILSPTSLS
ncbi:MAG: hypothetical protein PHQ58_04835 [Rhodoferax sp.]|uniref:hypothetical protein n=1 Tax=Rhodoferax sp. TaxID=50421 RepID=UPI00261B1E81|nr:hypothetical protein [Rhodoferax sp.]MDD2879739.1 hypothetical protein [Rhodoferax sp.]